MKLDEDGDSERRERWRITFSPCEDGRDTVTSASFTVLYSRPHANVSRFAKSRRHKLDPVRLQHGASYICLPPGLSYVFVSPVPSYSRLWPRPRRRLGTVSSTRLGGKSPLDTIVRPHNFPTGTFGTTMLSPMSVHTFSPPSITLPHRSPAHLAPSLHPLLTVYFFFWTDPV
jgi:hypothetical protein